MGCVGEHNVYGFAFHNPIMFSDPLGLAPITDPELINLYNQNRSKSIGEFVSDNWEYFVAGAMVIAGAVMVATGVGAAVGSGLIGSGISAAVQKSSTVTSNLSGPINAGIKKVSGRITSSSRAEGIVNFAANGLANTTMGMADSVIQEAINSWSWEHLTDEEWWSQTIVYSGIDGFNVAGAAATTDWVLETLSDEARLIEELAHGGYLRCSCNSDWNIGKRILSEDNFRRRFSITVFNGYT